MSVLSDLVWPLAVLIALAISVGGLIWLSRDEAGVRSRLRRRFILGVPWGSIIVLGSVFAVYLFVQGGFAHWDRPLFYPYINWSYLYPLGVLAAPFTHVSPGHLLANLGAAVVLAPLAEYIWGHYPEGETRYVELEPPWLRAFVVFPGVVFVVGIVSSLFAWGPVIGFSGVVFAFAGFTVVKYPLGTIIALGARTALRELGRAVTNPVVEATTTVSPPPWAGVSIQGHAFGFLVGAFLGLLLLHARPDVNRPSPLRLWLGTTIVAVMLGMWAIWQSIGDDTYVLYRGLGMALLLGLALVLTVAAVASDRSLWRTLTRRQTAILVFVIPILVLALIAVPLNVLSVAEHDPPERAIAVGDYDVYYAQDVDRQLGPAFPVPGLADSPSGTASGVIVVSESRHLWAVAISSSTLADEGDEVVALGGLGWRTDVSIDRIAWKPAGNESVYRVTLDDGSGERPAFASPAKEATPTVAGHSFAIEATDEGFFVRVTDPAGETVREPVPAENASVEAGDITIRRDDDRLLAEFDGTLVTIAER